MANVTIRSTHVPTGKFDDVTTSVIAAPSPGDWPAALALAGDTPIFTADGSTLAWGTPWQPGSGWGTDPERISVVSDAASKYGQVIEKRGRVNDKSGWRGALIHAHSLIGLRELYIRCVFQVSLNWEPHPGTGDKIFYYGQRVGSSSPTQFYALLTGGRQIYLVSQNVFAPAPGLVNFQMRPAGIDPIEPGEYVTLEVRHRLNSPGNADGHIRMAQDDVVVTEWDTPSFSLDAVEWVNPNKPDSLGHRWDPLTWGGGQLFRFWGGQAGTATRNDFWRLSELVVAGRN